MRAQTTISLFSTVISVAAISVACSSSSSGSTPSGACADYGNAQIAQEARCGAAPISADEKANYLSRFATVCNDAINAPGSGITPAYLEGCTAALGKNPACTIAVPECADPAGTLAIGAACASDDQCSSTHCALASSTSGDGGSSSAISCGKCAATIADGAPCQATDTCVAGDYCTNGACAKETTSTGGTGPLGSACQQDSDCATPNHCDFTQGECAAPAAQGSSCFSAADCVTGLICTSGEQCEAPVASGGQCSGGDCASGLGCDATTHKCAAITFAAQGAACDRDAILCDRGECNIGSSGGSTKGVCPKIIADGAACTSGDSTSTCDDFAACSNGTCQILDESSLCK